MPNPKKDPGIKKTHNMKVLLDDTQYALVQSAAKATGMKMAAYMRHQAIYGKIEIHSADLRPQPKMKMEPTSALTCYNAHGNNNR